MKHKVLLHRVGRRIPCWKGDGEIKLGQHYFQRAEKTAASGSQHTIYYHEGCLVDAYGRPFPCPDPNPLLPVERVTSNNTPLFPVRPLEVMEKKQDGNNQRD